VETVRALVAKAHLDNCTVGCAACPADHSHDVDRSADGERTVVVPELATA
jgi:hypothetical protein